MSKREERIQKQELAYQAALAKYSKNGKVGLLAFLEETKDNNDEGLPTTSFSLVEEGKFL